jgi:hypothetical protein
MAWLRPLKQRENHFFLRQLSLRRTLHMCFLRMQITQLQELLSSRFVPFRCSSNFSKRQVILIPDRNCINVGAGLPAKVR